VKIDVSKQIKFAGLCAAVAFTLTLSSCASITGAIDGKDVRAKFAFTIATMKAIRGDAHRAQGIIDRANRIEALLDGNPLIAIVDYDTQIKKAIGFDQLLPEDQLMADLLLSQLRDDLSKSIGEPGDPGSTKERARTIVEWIRGAAQSWLIADEVKRNQDKGIWLPEAGQAETS